MDFSDSKELTSFKAISCSTQYPKLGFKLTEIEKEADYILFVFYFTLMEFIGELLILTFRRNDNNAIREA
ncbi:hypothetical protein Lepto7376_2528 [[Leptolyngbya] sp. PCC 7376]|nr:hypothetical protein Lepto7376_2528 [[Leptolyngbya] sp. PCC 7376]